MWRRHGLAGFAFKDDKGAWTGLDVDYCRAIAAAVLKDPEKVNYIPLTTKLRFTALKAGDVDVLIREFDTDFHPRHPARAQASPASTSMPAKGLW